MLLGSREPEEDIVNLPRRRISMCIHAVKNENGKFGIRTRDEVLQQEEAPGESSSLLSQGSMSLNFLSLWSMKRTGWRTFVVVSPVQADASGKSAGGGE